MESTVPSKFSFLPLLVLFTFRFITYFLFYYLGFSSLGRLKFCSLQIAVLITIHHSKFNMPNISHFFFSNTTSVALTSYVYASLEVNLVDPLNFQKSERIQSGNQVCGKSQHASFRPVFGW